MTWQILITAQIFVSALMAILARKMVLTDRKLFFAVGLVSYAVIAMAGFAYSTLFGMGLPQLPTGRVWMYLVAEGLFIPASWLLQYKIISKLGASNAVLITVLNSIGAALLGFLLLGDSFSPTFVIGAVFILTSIYLAFRIQPDNVHRESSSMTTKLLLVAGMVVFFSFGMYAEKQAIDIIGVWNYAAYGWGLQFVGALLIFALYGRSEWAHISLYRIRWAVLLGLITSVAGALYIYALSIGTLSDTVIAVSGKIALTTLFAALFLGERNSLRLRVLAFSLSMIGLWFLVG